MEKDDIVSSFFVAFSRWSSLINCRLRSCVPGLAYAQIRQSPHLAGFVVESWWAGVV